MSPDKRRKIAAGVLYAAFAILGLISAAVVAFEFFGPQLIADLYAKNLSPRLNALITDRSYPVWHFQMVAGHHFYGLVLRGATIAVIAALAAFVLRTPVDFKRAVRPAASFFRGLPSLYRWTVAALLCGLLAMQVIDANRLTFPFTSWKVYGKMYLPYELEHYEFRARTAGGDTVMVNPERLWRSADGIIYNGLERRAQAIQDRTPEADPVLFEKILRAMAGEYARRSGTKLVALDVARVTNSPLQTDTVWHRTEVVRRIEVPALPDAAAAP
jgi:hypothetical protein